LVRKRSRVQISSLAHEEEVSPERRVYSYIWFVFLLTYNK
jgi:hypothetical protein